MRYATASRLPDRLGKVVEAPISHQRIIASSDLATPSRWRLPDAIEWRSMRITVFHNRPKEEIMRSFDRSFDDLFKGFGAVPIQILNESRKWTGRRIDFSFNAKMDIVSTQLTPEGFHSK